VHLAALHHAGAYGDGEIHVAIEAEIPHSPGIDAPLDRLQHIDHAHGLHLGCPAHGPGGKRRLEHIDGIEPRQQRALDVGDQVHHMGIALDHQLFRQTHRPGYRDATQIVATKIDQHDVLGNLLFVGQQFLAQRLVFGNTLAPRPCAGNGPLGELALLEAHQDLRRGTHHGQITEIQMVHVRSWAQEAQGAVQRHG